MIPPPLYTTRTACRVCGGRFDPLLDLGDLVLSDFLAPDQPDPPSAPLDLVVCQACSLVQLRHVVDNDRLYRRYWYQSGVNESMVAELADIVHHAIRTVGGLSRGDTVLDVGANDGTLLSQYTLAEAPIPRRYAIEPSLSFFNTLSAHADCVITNYFPCAETTGIPAHSVKILTAIAMFYDLDHPVAFVDEVDRLLAPDGVWIVQMQDLAQMVAATGYDNTCFEHRCYYSTESFAGLLTGTNLHVDRVDMRAINGGSLRYTIRRAKYTQDSGATVERQLRREDPWTSREALDRFAWRVGEHRAHLQAILGYHQDRGDLVDLYAASTKSSTLLQHCGIDNGQLRQVAERSAGKVGKVTSGTRIPIVSEETWREDPAPITVVGAWGFRESFLRREQEYLAKGGRFIFPLPALEVVSGGR